MTARDALLSLPGAEHHALHNRPFRQCLDTLDAVPSPRGTSDLLPLAAMVLALCLALAEEQRHTAEIVKRQARPMIVCLDPSRCLKGGSTDEPTL